MNLTKNCSYCGTEFVISVSWQKAKRFCTTSCSAKWRMSQPEYLAKVHNPEVAAKRGRSVSQYLKTPEGQKRVEFFRNIKPMQNEESRRRMSETLRRIGHKPKVRGGNGHGMTVPQSILKDWLIGEWIAEYAVTLGKKQDGYPTNYKLDLANVFLKIGIEVDGYSHNSRKHQDAKKDAKLCELGWTVIRITNKQILQWQSEGFLTDGYVPALLKEYDILIKEA